jgi:hypothetical protein
MGSQPDSIAYLLPAKKKKLISQGLEIHIEQCTSGKKIPSNAF